MGRWTVGVGLLVAGLVGAGCNPTCSSTCRRYYEPDQCDGAPTAIPLDEAIDQCVEVCSVALTHAR